MEKPLEKPLIPMVEMWKTIDNDGSLVKKPLKNHWPQWYLDENHWHSIVPKNLPSPWSSWKADWFWFARGRRGKAYFLVTARNRKYRVFLEDRERGKRCVMLKQAKVGSKKLRDLSCVDKPLPGGAQGCALLQLRWVLETRLCQGRGQGLEVGDKHVMEDLS